MRKISEMLRKLVMGYSEDENGMDDPILGELDVCIDTVIPPPRKKIVIQHQKSHNGRMCVKLNLLKANINWIYKIKNRFGIPCNYFIKVFFQELWKMRKSIEEELEACETERDVRDMLKRHIVIQ